MKDRHSRPEAPHSDWKYEPGITAVFEVMHNFALPQSITNLSWYMLFYWNTNISLPIPALSKTNQAKQKSLMKDDCVDLHMQRSIQCSVQFPMTIGCIWARYVIGRLLHKIKLFGFIFLMVFITHHAEHDDNTCTPKDIQQLDELGLYQL